MFNFSCETALGVLLIINALAIAVFIALTLSKKFRLRNHMRYLVREGYFIHRYAIDSMPTEGPLAVSAGILAMNGYVITDHGGNVVGELQRKNANEPLLRLKIVDQ